MSDPQPPGRILLALAIVVLAGCVGGGAGDVSAATADTNGAKLKGLVVDTELQPISTAIIKVGELPPVPVRPDGRFEMDGLTPGEVRVAAYALEFTAASRSVSLIQGEAAFIQFTLERLPIEEPYVEYKTYRGYDVCSASIFYSAGYIAPCLLGTRTAVFKTDVAESWAYGVFEMAWQSPESMLFVATHRPNVCNTGEPCWGIEVGRSPIRLDAKPLDVPIAKRHALEDAKFKMYPQTRFTMYLDSVYAGLGREELNNTLGPQCASLNPSLGLARRFGCPLGVGYSLGISFHYYHTIFHFEAPADPESFTGLPDR